jgi:hypothetical protein
MAERTTLKDLVRRVLASGLALGSAAQTLPALPTPLRDPREPPLEPNGNDGAAIRELVLRPARPKIFLRALDATKISLISSHRSHRSHSSHRSHYSSSTGGGTRTPPPPARVAAPVTAADTVLGFRVMSRGMRGKDVDELLTLLILKNLLPVKQIPDSSIFNADIEAIIKKFQESKGITADGKVGYQTLLLLKALP